ncbi:MAG: hypothetical protein GF329_01440 [Candidatus Lokiarchaeota archaeon]|nr:hypothetical protein [Candidatus Lokiarchaeota archaeon]
MISELKLFIEPTRYFQYDYILFDMIFLFIWLFFLIKNKKWNALSFGLVCAVCVYFIDAIWWWNSAINGKYIREYWIGKVEMPHPLVDFFWTKFSCDFMMCISYSLFAFPWMWIMYEKIKRKVSEQKFSQKDRKEVLFYTSLYFASWMLIPLFTLIVPLDDSIVYTVRHMHTQLFIWIINFFIGYSILAILYGTNLIKRKNQKIIGYVFIIGCAESFFMEFPLFIYRIRPTGPTFLLFQILFLVNQGAPYLFIAYDLVLPYLGKGIKLIKNKITNPLNINNS